MFIDGQNKKLTWQDQDEFLVKQETQSAGSYHGQEQMGMIGLLSARRHNWNSFMTNLGLLMLYLFKLTSLGT